MIRLSLIIELIFSLAAHNITLNQTVEEMINGYYNKTCPNLLGERDSLGSENADLKKKLRLNGATGVLGGGGGALVWATAAAVLVGGRLLG